jgi:mannose-6-phosphate isomerase-like protein (cupin superfamily)
MAVRRTPNKGPSPGRDELERRFREEGLSPKWWSNGPGDTYGWHAHPYHKILFCSEGTIVFHMGNGDVELRAGDRLDIEPGTEHAATVGAEGVVCVETPRSP